MDDLRQGLAALILVHVTWVAAAALQLSETASVTTLAEASDQRLALARIERVEVSPPPPPAVSVPARVAAPIRPMLGARSLGPGTDVERSDPWSLSRVSGTDLCTTGREAHCAKPDGVLDRPDPLPAAGWLAEEVVDRAIRHHLGPVEACYRAARVRDPELAGSVLVELDVSADGTVARARLAESTLQAPATEACLVERFGYVRFPPPAGDSDATIRWRLLLTPG